MVSYFVIVFLFIMQIDEGSDAVAIDKKHHYKKISNKSSPLCCSSDCTVTNIIYMLLN